MKRSSDSVRRVAVRLTAAVALTGPLLAHADSACWREPLLIGQRVAGLVNAYQLWSAPQQTPGEPRSADEPPPADAIPSLDANGRPGRVLHCGQIRTRVNGNEAQCTGQPDQDYGTMWVPVIDGPVNDRVRVALKAGGAAWVNVRPDHVFSGASGADPQVAAASLARHGLPGMLVISTDHRVEPSLWPHPQAQGGILAWTPEQEGLALAFALRTAPDLPAPHGPWLTSSALTQGGQWQLLSQVIKRRHTPQGEWWQVQQWLQPVNSIDRGVLADGALVLASSDSVRSPTLRQGWVRHRDAHGRILAVITDGPSCD